MLKEFRAFVMRGNVLDLAVGIVIGAAFGAIVGSFVADVVMPPIGLLLGNVDFANLYVIIKAGVPAGPYASLAAAKQAGAVTMNIGVFVNTIINFLIIAFAVFMVVRAFNRARARFEAEKAAAAPTAKDCPYCLSKIDLRAKRCPNCTSQLDK